MASPELARARQMYVDLLAQMTANPEATIDELRQLYEDFAEAFPVPADAEVASVSVSDVPCLAVTAAGTRPDRTIVHLHGGGYITGSARSYRALGVDMAKAADARVILVDYRLAPEHPHPAAVEDAVAVVRGLLAEGVSPDSLIVSGDSAGGGLAIATLVALKDLEAPAVAGGVAFSPWVDATLSSASMDDNDDPLVAKPLLENMALMRLGAGTGRGDPLASPLFADLGGLPPLRVFVGSPEALLDDARGLAAAAQRAGTPVELTIEPDMVHVWPIFASFLPEARNTIDEAAAFITSVTRAADPVRSSTVRR